LQGSERHAWRSWYIHGIRQETLSGILSEIKSGQDQGTAYEPARDPEILTIKYVVDALEQSGTDDIPVVRSDELERLAGSLESFSKLVEKSEANLLLKQIG